MSYESSSEFPEGTSLKAVIELIELLGYEKFDDQIKAEDQKAAYYWYERTDYKSHSAIFLWVRQPKGGLITVNTRTNAARSYWDLFHQNKTLRLFRDLLDAPFTTDAGRNRYWHPDKPLSPITSGCYLARSRFNNALIKARFYLMHRGLDNGIGVIDEMNPRLFSNNLLLPYLVAIWEEYFKSTFAAVLKYAPNKVSAIKKARLSHDKLEYVAAGVLTVEDAIAEAFSFQRPKIISSNFKFIDSGFDLAAAMRKPYRRRKQTLFDTIDGYIDIRNELVHTGNIDLTLTDKLLKKALNDFEVTIDRSYDSIAHHFGFDTVRNF